jgi:hypothetical protein
MNSFMDRNELVWAGSIIKSWLKHIQAASKEAAWKKWAYVCQDTQIRKVNSRIRPNSRTPMPPVVPWSPNKSSFQVIFTDPNPLLGLKLALNDDGDCCVR